MSMIFTVIYHPQLIKVVISTKIENMNVGIILSHLSILYKDTEPDKKEVNKIYVSYCKLWVWNKYHKIDGSLVYNLQSKIMISKLSKTALGGL